jgi:hypothetical protein
LEHSEVIKEYVIHYEIQQHDSPHSHIILWAVENDIENITKEIVAFLPTFDEKKRIYTTHFTKLY